MSNGKICGECHFYNPKTTRNGCGMCTTGLFKGLYVDPFMKACVWSIGGSKRQITNGDRIRQMNNTDLAEMLVYPVKPMNINGDIHYEFTSCLLLGKSYPMREQAVFLTERQLNAPAGKDTNVPANESEVNNGFSKCEYCGKTYRKKKKAQRFCSIKCKDKWWNRERTGDREYLHPQCEDNFNGEW